MARPMFPPAAPDPPGGSAPDQPAATPGRRAPSEVQLAWLRRGLDQPGGKLPLFDDSGRRVGRSTVRACLRAGWAEPWFHNPLKPNWEVCRLTAAGRAMLDQVTVVTVDFRRGVAGRNAAPSQTRPRTAAAAPVPFRPRERS